MALTPVVLDISHHQELESDAFAKMRDAGIQGVIHKASEGTGYVDKTYAARRKDCEAAGVMWGAYHFARGGSPEAQVEHFLRCAKPDDSTLLALDWEDKAMSAAGARRFLNALMAKTGRRPDQVWIYTGHVGKELITSDADKAYFAQFPLWLCQYTTKAKPTLPKAWDKYGLWQYSDKGHFAGIKRGGSVDLNVFGGKNLKAEWAAGPKPVAVTVAKPEPEAPKVTPADLVPVSRKATTINRAKNAAHTIWVSLTLGSILEYVGVAKQTADQVSLFIHEHAVVILITAAIIGVLLAKYVMSLMADDVNEGRAVPSGGLPAQ